MNNPDQAARVGVMHAMLSVSMSAQQAVLQGWQVNALHLQAVETLPAGDDLRQAVISFAGRYPDLRRDAYAVRLLGEELGRALQIALNPEAQAPVRYRGDVDG